MSRPDATEYGMRRDGDALGENWALRGWPAQVSDEDLLEIYYFSRR